MSELNKEINFKNMKIVCIGGGTGLFSLLSGLKKYVPNKNILKVIVTTMDNGGSSGKLITQYGVLPPGDVRNCIVALSEESQELNKLFQYRFDQNLDEHNFGNLLITALTDITGSFGKATKLASKLLRIKGEIIPVSLNNNNLIAETEDGKEIFGETLIDTTKNKKITKLKLERDSLPNKRAFEVLKKADIIIFGPGDLYTSIIPNILFPEIRDTINKNKKAKKILITSVMSKPGETDNYRVSDFKFEIEKYLGGKITHVLANSHIPLITSLREYQKEDKYPILVDSENIKNCKLIKANLIDENKILRHHPTKLAKEIIKLI